MRGAALLADLAARGVRVTIEEGGRVALDGPRPVLTDEVVETVRAHKPELVALLVGRRQTATAAECGWCGNPLAPYLFDLAGRPSLLCPSCHRWTAAGGEA